MHRGVANTDKTESLAREFLHRSQGDLKLILTNHILPRVNFNGHNPPLIPMFKPRSKALVHPFPLVLESMNVVSRWHLTHRT